MSIASLARADDARRAAKDINPDDILHSAQAMCEAMLAENFGKVADAMFPKDVETAGGREKVIAKFKDAFAKMKKTGYAIKSIRVDVPTAVADAGDDIVAIVPQTVVTTGPDGKWTSKSYWVGVSHDQGKTWTFIDGAHVNDVSIKTLLPKFPANLKLPVQQKASFEPKK